jgi:glucosamine 6-phosphate synthetase-like amidotransferase/phosphosugar isomerase protein
MLVCPLWRGVGGGLALRHREDSRSRTGALMRSRVSPLLEILPVQQLALPVAVARGGDPDTPRGLSKVPETL